MKRIMIILIGFLIGYAYAQTPNDTYYWRQYYLENDTLYIGSDAETDQDINILKAWRIAQPDSNLVIGMIDSSPDTLHPELANSYGGKWKNCVSSSTITYNSLHGTQTTGILFAERNNNFSMAGILGAYDGLSGAKWIIAIPINYQSTLVEKDVTSSILWMKGKTPLINMSLVTSQEDQIKQALIRYSNASGMGYIRDGGIVVAAAGNVGTEIINSPAYYTKELDCVIAVAATDWNDEKWSGSNYEEDIDVSAPGHLLPLVYNSSNDIYASGSGTSFSAPIVTGVVGLLISKYPNYFTRKDIKTLIRNSTDDTGYANEGEDWEGKIGTGRVNAYKTLKNAEKLVRKRNCFF